MRVKDSLSRRSRFNRLTGLFYNKLWIKHIYTYLLIRGILFCLSEFLVILSADLSKYQSSSNATL